MNRSTLSTRPRSGGPRQGAFGQLVGRLRFRQLALLAALGEHFNLHRAAEAVHMAQPSATKVVRDLERLFGFPLFERLPRGMHPTPLGAEVLSFASRALTDLLRFAEDLDLKRQGGNGQLIIGTVSGAAAEHTARAVAELKERRPLLSVKLLSESAEELIALLLARKIDVAVASLVDPTLHNLVNYESLDSETLCIVVRATHPATRAHPLQLTALQNYPWILPPVPAPARQFTEQAFGEAHMKSPANTIESASCFTTLQILQRCDAVAVLPESVIRDHLRAGLIAQLPLLADKHLSNFGILTRRDEPLAPPPAEFIDLLRRASAIAPALTSTDPTEPPRQQPASPKQTQRKRHPQSGGHATAGSC
jgi:DNA-binding transcriptional LysR family regulator